MRILVLLFFLGTPFVLAAPVPKDRRKKPDAELIQGKWQVVGRIDNGSPRAGSGRENCFWTFSQSTVQIDRGAAQTIVIDESKNPKQLDLVYAPTNVYHGIYHLEGDRFKWHNTSANGYRPTEFGGEGYLILFERVKE
jgi:uncharacterized protein (TIGR03067 family)